MAQARALKERGKKPDGRDLLEDEEENPGVRKLGKKKALGLGPQREVRQEKGLGAV